MNEPENVVDMEELLEMRSFPPRSLHLIQDSRARWKIALYSDSCYTFLFRKGNTCAISLIPKIHTM